jgi:hypothetical protein
MYQPLAPSRSTSAETFVEWVTGVAPGALQGADQGGFVRVRW